MMGASAVAARMARSYEASAQSVPRQKLRSGFHLVTGGAGSLDAQSGGPIAYARLEIIAALRARRIMPRFRYNRERDFSSYWFVHSIFGLETKIVEAAVYLPAADSSNGAQAASRLMEISCANVARITVIDALDSNRDCKTLSMKGFLDIAISTRSCEWLRLGTCGASFLDRLGRHTRRNVRLALRAQSQSDMQFLFQPNAESGAQDPAIARLARRNKPRPHKAKHLAAYERLIEGKQSRFESRLTLADGRLVSYCRGYIQENVAYLIYQANDPVVPKINLSLLHRFKLIEHLIASGVTDCIFPFGCEGLLKNICETVTLEERLAVRVSLKGTLTALALAVFLPGTRISRLTLRTLSSAPPLDALSRKLGKVLRGVSLLFLSPYVGLAKNRRL